MNAPSKGSRGLVYLLRRGMIAFLAIIILSWLIGLCLPSAHTNSSTSFLPHPQTEVWSAIHDVPALTIAGTLEFTGRKDLPPSNGLPVWEEYIHGSTLRVETLEITGNSLLVRQITDDQGHTCKWTCTLAPATGGTTVQIIENIDFQMSGVSTPFLRLSVWFWPISGIDDYLARLEKTLTPAPPTKETK